ncbi:hypothetical protein LJC42_03305 [Eubacteriales bacterium OttesenSCG-928-K08]|nr:hypothetical protein [Eubacteriales bacterium OttesenSCG-928-K08]
MMHKRISRMLTLLLCLSILAGIVPQAQVAHAATEGTVQVSGEGVLNANRVNIRPGPSTKNTALGKARKGDVFNVTGFTIPSGFSQGFFQVEGETITGSAYIAGNYLNVTFTAPLNGKITKKGYLYTAKSTSRKYRAESIAVGETLPLYAREGKWWRTEVNGQTLWAPIASVLQVQGAAATSGILLTPSTTKSTTGSVRVSVSGVEGASFVGWRRHTTGATYTSKSGFRDITAAKQFPANSNGWYAVGVVDAQGNFRYELIHITNIVDYSSHDSSGGSATTQKTNITFTAAQVGGVSNTTNSTGIELTFSQAVTDLTAGDITIADGTGAVVKGTLSGSGMVWTIALADVTAQGSVDVSIADFGAFQVTNNPQTVTVFLDSRTYTLSVNNLSTQAAVTYGSAAITTGAATGNIPDASVTVTATPAANRVFVGWVTSNDRKATPVSTDAAYTFNINSDTTLYAIFNGDGVGAPNEIATKAELAAVANDLTKSYKLLNDIDIASTWAPIGTIDNGFAGDFDGNGHAVHMQNVDFSGVQYSGLFGELASSGTIKNLVVDGSISKTDTASVIHAIGGITGNNKGTIERCAVTVTVTVDFTNAIIHIGGIAGNNENASSISNCYYSGSIVKTNTGAGFVGGIAGRNAGMVQNCYAGGSIAADANNDTLMVGGIAGIASGANILQNCVALHNSISAERGDAGRIYAGAGNLGKNNHANAAITIQEGGVNKQLHEGVINPDGAPCTLPLDATWWETTSNLGWDWTNVWQLPTIAGELPTLR